MEYQQTHMNKGDTYDATISAHPFDAYMARIEAAYLRDIVPTLADRHSRYLDFASGTGRITETVSPLVGESIGVDISDSMLRIARQKCPAVRFLCMDIAHDSEDLGQFDLATSFRFFGNAEDDLRRTVLRALARLIRPGGHLIVNSHRNPRALGTLVMGACRTPKWHGPDTWEVPADAARSRFRGGCRAQHRLVAGSSASAQ